MLLEDFKLLSLQGCWTPSSMLLPLAPKPLMFRVIKNLSHLGRLVCVDC